MSQTLSEKDLKLLMEIAQLETIPQGAYNIRKNGEAAGRASSENIVIVQNEDKPGIDITIAPGTKNESVHIPVIITESGYTEMVYNEFFVGEGADVLIVAGCGIHNSSCDTAQHDGIHTFHVGKNARVKYVERHYGDGEGTGEKVMNPETVIYLDEGAYMELETTQIKGVDSTNRKTTVVCQAGAEVVINEKLFTHGVQHADSTMDIVLEGTDASGRIVSRSVARDESVQIFYPSITGKACCFGHVQCDSIIMDAAKIRSIPTVAAEHPKATLIHEAAIGKIAGEQIQKLMTLGLTQEEAEETILSGFMS
ncbi:MAG: SufD family Fe-S cluster assembly protein [Clostridia bacterium]|nr:SufD family Fe-S cluster assembly protein [Clostridia bacterium]